MKENWDLKVLSLRETKLHLMYAEANPEKAAAHFIVSLMDKEDWHLQPGTRSVPIHRVVADDILPHHLETDPGKILFTEDHARSIIAFQDASKIGSEYHRVIVHCLAGVSRSTAVAIAMLIHAGFTYDEAFDKVYAQRPVMHPNLWILQIFDKVLEQDGKLNEYFKQWYKKREFSWVSPEKQYNF